MAFVTPTPITRASRTTTIARTPLRRPSVSSTSRRASLRMIATEQQQTATPVSGKARELLSYVRGHKSIFRPGKGFNSTQATLFRKNDTGRSFTPLDELATNAKELPGGSVAAFMVVQEDQLVETACAAVFAAADNIEGDDTLNEIISFDLRYLLRVISYGAACKSTNFIHDNNIGMMKMLHREVGISVAADIAGLKASKDAVLAQVTDNSLMDSTAACFDVVIDYLS